MEDDQLGLRRDTSNRAKRAPFARATLQVGQGNEVLEILLAG